HRGGVVQSARGFLRQDVHHHRVRRQAVLHRLRGVGHRAVGGGGVHAARIRAGALAASGAQGSLRVSIVDRAILSINRRDTPPAALGQDAYRRLMSWNLPDSAAVRRVYSSLYYAHDAVVGALEWLGGKLLYEPMLRSRAEVGPGLRLSALPYINGHARISIGADCSMGKFTVISGPFVGHAQPVIRQESPVRHHVFFL